jgi:hypothetical protein
MHQHTVMISESSSVQTLMDLTATTNFKTDINSQQQQQQQRDPSVATARICRMLPIDYKLGDNDVHCGRGKNRFSHIGNSRFRNIIASNLNRYNNAVTKIDKSNLIFEIVDYVRHHCQSTGQGVGFIKIDPRTGLYYEVGDMIAVSTCAGCKMYRYL